MKNNSHVLINYEENKPAHVADLDYDPTPEVSDNSTPALSTIDYRSKQTSNPLQQKHSYFGQRSFSQVNLNDSNS